jgi:hypothetical protein
MGPGPEDFLFVQAFTVTDGNPSKVFLLNGRWRIVKAALRAAFSLDGI